MSVNPVKRKLALSATIIASSMGFIDGTVVHIALPSIQRELGASFATLQWIANSYLLALCALLVVSGALGDRYGPRRLFLFGIAGFTAASVACAVAPNGSLLVLARTLQGVAAALMLPQSLSIIARLYPPEHRGKAVGIWSAAASAAAACGPVVGGYLVDNGGWSYAFWINLPLGIIAFVLTKYAVPKGSVRKQVALDWQGAGLLVMALGTLVFATINVSIYPWSSTWVWPGWMAGICCVAVFLYWERYAPSPILPAHFMANREFLLLNAYCLTIFVTFTAMLFLMPYMLISSLRLSASTAGLVMLPMGVCISLLARPAGGWADRVGYRLPMVSGAVGIALSAIAACTLVWLRTPWAGALIVAAFGISAGLMVTPLTTGVLNSVATEESGLASGINHAVTRIGNLAAIAIFGALLVLGYRSRLTDSLAMFVTDERDRKIIAEVVQQSATDLTQTDLGVLPQSMVGPAQVALTYALDRSFVAVMLLASVFGFAAAGCAWFLDDRGVNGGDGS